MPHKPKQNRKYYRLGIVVLFFLVICGIGCFVSTPAFGQESPRSMRSAYSEKKIMVNDEPTIQHQRTYYQEGRQITVIWTKPLRQNHTDNGLHRE